MRVENTGAGTDTFTPSAGTINGGASFPLAQGQNCVLATDNTNWTTSCAPGQVTAGTGITITPSATGDAVAVTSGTYAPASGIAGSALASHTVTAAYLGAQYSTWTCETGLGDGLNAFTSGTYLQHFCVNKTGVTVTITGVSCYADGGSPTLNASGTTLGALLTGAVTCTTAAAGAAGTQSANVALTNGDAIDFTFVSGSTAKQTTWVVTGTY
jgi:hypothetical protein